MGHCRRLAGNLLTLACVLVPLDAFAITLSTGDELTAIPSTPEEAAQLGLIAGSPSLRAARWTTPNPDPFNDQGLIQDPDTGERYALLSDRYVGWIAGMGEAGTFTVTLTRPTGPLTTEIRFDGSCWYLNGSSSPFTCGSTFLLLQVTSPVNCNASALGAWRLRSVWDAGSDGVDVVDPLHDIPFKVVASGEVRVLPMSSFLQVDVPAADPHPPIPGETIQVNLVAFDPVCSVGISGTTVRGTFRFLAGSGGHEHQTTDRPAVPAGVPNMALSSVVPITRGATFNASTGVLSGVTGSDGVVSASVTAGQVAGLVQITGDSPGNPLLTPRQAGAAVVHLGLSPLPDSAAYVLVGATVAHGDNHYVSDNFQITRRIDSFADRFNIDSLFDQPSRNYVHRINDASLETGGLFDISGGWSPAHDSHRIGLDVDVSASAFDQGSGAVVPATRAIFRALLRHQDAEDPSVRIFIEGDHFHLRYF